jgi:hypothetical protein
MANYPHSHAVRIFSTLQPRFARRFIHESIMPRSGSSTRVMTSAPNGKGYLFVGHADIRGLAPLSGTARMRNSRIKLASKRKSPAQRRGKSRVSQSRGLVWRPLYPMGFT